jgi:catechol 2,3-dioxygenase-like lactoylglutathione lyase family enzyme
MTTPPPLRGIHHLKIAVSDLAAAERFYTNVFGARRLTEADHVDDGGRLYACIFDVPGLGPLLELRLDPAQAGAHRGFDPMTLAVRDRAELARWQGHLDALGVAHSGELVSLQAWLTVLADPDGTRLRLYTLERHGPELRPQAGNPWLEPVTDHGVTG